MAKTPNRYPTPTVLKKIKTLYHQYKAYVRVDLIMYAVMLILIIAYIIYTLAL